MQVNFEFLQSHFRRLLGNDFVVAPYHFALHLELVLELSVVWPELVDTIVHVLSMLIKLIHVWELNYMALDFADLRFLSLLVEYDRLFVQLGLHTNHTLNEVLKLTVYYIILLFNFLKVILVFQNVQLFGWFLQQEPFQACITSFGIISRRLLG